MTPRLAILTCLACVGARGDCLTVSGERILASDLARLAPAFSAVAPETVIGFAPSAGGRQVFTSAQLTRLALRYGLTLPPGLDACFVRPFEALTEERVAAALMAVLPTAHIEVLDFSRQPAPRGELSFSRNAVNAPALWHGVVSAPGQADFPVWAVARIEIRGRRVVSRELLAAGQRIEPRQVMEEDYTGPPGLPNLAEVAGHIARRPIPPGVVIEFPWLDPPAEVLRGSRVRVEIRSGVARVLAQGTAEASGRRGESIAVRILNNGKLVHARVVGQQEVALTAGTGPASSAWDGAQ